MSGQFFKHCLRFSRLALRIVACVFLLASSSTSATETSIHFLIPGSAGGGWDLTARAVGRVLTESKLIDSARYENLAGGGGGKAIAHLIEVADPNILMVNSTPIVVRSLQQVFPQSFRDLTPIASVIGDYSVIAVRADSPILTMADLGRQQLQDSRSVAIAGGSVRGSTDHIVAAMAFRGFGATPQSVKYIPYDTGGKAMVGLLSGEVQALSSGLGEVIDLVNQGRVRLLCTASPERLAISLDTPTCTEVGSTGTVFVNWRGFFTAPNINPKTSRHYREILQKMYATPLWQQTRTRYGWIDLYLSGAEFIEMLDQQEKDLSSLLTQLGMLEET